MAPRYPIGDSAARHWAVVRPSDRSNASMPLRPLAATGAVWLAAAWLLGIGRAGARVLREWRGTSRLRRRCQPIGDRALTDCCQTLSVGLGLRRAPELLRSEEVGSPVLVGGTRPAIVMPASLLTTCRRQELELLVAHELAHVRRHDLWWAWLPTITGALYWFHPLVWLAQREWRLAQEMACDELAVLLTGAPALQYGQMVLKVAAQGRGQPCGEPAAAGVVGSYATLRQRLVALPRIRPISLRRWRLIGTLLSATGAVAIVPWQVTARSAPSTIQVVERGGPRRHESRAATRSRRVSEQERLRRLAEWRRQQRSAELAHQRQLQEQAHQRRLSELEYLRRLEQEAHRRRMAEKEHARALQDREQEQAHLRRLAEQEHKRALQVREQEEAHLRRLAEREHAQRLADEAHRRRLAEQERLKRVEALLLQYRQVAQQQAQARQTAGSEAAEQARLRSVEAQIQAEQRARQTRTRQMSVLERNRSMAAQQRLQSEMFQQRLRRQLLQQQTRERALKQQLELQQRQLAESESKLQDLSRKLAALRAQQAQLEAVRQQLQREAIRQRTIEQQMRDRVRQQGGSPSGTGGKRQEGTSP